MIAATAERVREMGVPDSLNRWIGMTPEELAQNQRATARIMKQTQAPAGLRKTKGKFKSALDLPKSVEPEGLALRKQMQKDAEEAKKRRLRELREHTQAKSTKEKPTMTTKTGTKEAALKAAREKHLADVEEATKPKPAKAPGKAKEAASKPRASRAPKAGKAAPAAAAKSPKGGQSKTEIAVKMLMKSATRKEIADATDWPSINLKPIAKRRGLKLVEGKDGVFRAHAA